MCVINDKELLKIFMKGFHDELHSTLIDPCGTQLEINAYKLVALHAIVGDDVRSIDYLSDEQILNDIKNGLR